MEWFERGGGVDDAVFSSNYVTKRLHEWSRKGASAFINLFMHNFNPQNYLFVRLNIIFYYNQIYNIYDFCYISRRDFNQSCESESEQIEEFSGSPDLEKLCRTRADMT